MDVDQLSDSDSSDVWVPRKLSAAEAVSGIWIVCGQASNASNLRSARPPTLRRLHCTYHLRADMENPDPVFRRRVSGGFPYSQKCCRAGATDFGGRSSETVDRRLTARERRRAWRTAATQCRIRHMDSDLTPQQDSTSILSQSHLPQRFDGPQACMRHTPAADAGVDDGQETPIKQLPVDRDQRSEADTDRADDEQQRNKDSQDTEESLHPRHSAITTTAVLASSLLERLTSFRHGRPIVQDDRHKQHKLIENRASKALRTITTVIFSALRHDFLHTRHVLTTRLVFPRYIKDLSLECSSKSVPQYLHSVTSSLSSYPS